ncbi:DUF4254 domain-containing protein [Mucilaginibacter sp. L3T2-6]|uniref:DUF4254 domain-containing protein n=1 Tax=Mucilaginibacter sp. L3T2-6 TaxID=3062491 RepID=UPI0026776511|nr:DUF4254 domain-containing protein [Mucilaginibacter sp. L3T2-6]MDO3642747.1 DUF4254 domain-containing protein [Mucilaginibacter sp. L3T2-6]MDV6215396.1 DUF4254 domain-containing protein [Mucilaginibacter sp. L3T2-6]
MVSGLCNSIFSEAIEDYHLYNDIDYCYVNPYETGSFENLLYAKCWIDTAQWHMEDEIRNPEIDPVLALKWKRRIDKSNQDRTDLVEHIDSYFLEKYKNILPEVSARINTESPAWAIDRLSILALKIYHMKEESVRKNVDDTELARRKNKLNILLQQQADLSVAIDELLTDIEQGKKYMKVYRQMKMYNDPELNPVLYNSKK